MALLAIYAAKKADNETLEEYLNNQVFADVSRTTRNPDPADVNGFRAYMEKYRQLLPVEQAAIDNI